MKKIGILTFHRSYNYGAFMQCYSLSTQIAKDFPDCRVEVVDYCTRRMYENYPTSFVPFVLGPNSKRNSINQMVKQVGKCVLDPHFLKRKRELYHGFDEDINTLQLSSFHIVSDEYKDLFKIIDENYDVLIVGSDAVWEYKTYPFPNAYYPNYDFKRTKLLSYAASADRMHSSELTDDNKSYIKETLARFSYIGIRDVATQNFLTAVSPELGLHHNCDPTAFVDFDSMPRNLDRVKKVLLEAGIDLEKPIIGIMGNNESCDMLRNMFGNRYQIVSVYQHTNAADYNFDYLTPFEWARIFSLFSITVTKFFHGSMLSLKNGTPTIATDYWFKVKEDHVTKIEDLYNRLGLEDHYFYMPEVGHKSELMKDRIEYFIQHPDREKIITRLTDESIAYESFREALKASIE